MSTVNLNKKKLTLSIVIPAYNEEDHITACLEAIAAQTTKPDQVILVDNNSSDKTVELARRYKFLTIINEPEQGIVYARNTGFEASTGQLIGRVDVDTLLLKDWVARVHQFYSEPDHQAYSLTGGGYFYNVRAPRFNGWLQGQVLYRFVRLVIGHYSLWGSNMVIPRSVWDSVKLECCVRNDVHEDVDLGMHADQLGYKICYNESLRVGVYAKRIWTERDQLRQALARWPQTMRVHQRKGWWVPVVCNALLLKVVIPIGLAADYFSTTVGRR